MIWPIYFALIKRRGIRIYLVRDNGVPKKADCGAAFHFKSFLYRFCTATARTDQECSGGFGGMVPETTQSSGTRYYGIG